MSKETEIVSFKNLGFQGDVMFRRIKALPKDVELTQDKVVAHSETGHHHTVATADTRVYARNKRPAALQLGPSGFADIRHLRSFDTHKTVRLEGDPNSTWEIVRQREFTPEGWRQVLD